MPKKSASKKPAKPSETKKEFVATAAALMLTDYQAAEKLGMQVQTLRNWRSSAKILPFVRIGRSIRYRTEDIEALIESSIVSVDGK